MADEVKQIADVTTSANQDGSRAAETAAFVEARGAATSELRSVQPMRDDPIIKALRYVLRKQKLPVDLLAHAIAVRKMELKKRKGKAVEQATSETWVMKFDDTEAPDEIFAGEGAAVAAQRRYDEASANWAVTLFRSVPPMQRSAATSECALEVNEKVDAALAQAIKNTRRVRQRLAESESWPNCRKCGRDLIFCNCGAKRASECAPCLIETIEKNRLCVVPPNQETPDWTVYAEFDGEFGYDNEIGAGATLRDALQMAAAAIADTEDVR